MCLRHPTIIESNFIGCTSGVEESRELSSLFGYLFTFHRILVIMVSFIPLVIAVSRR